MGVHSPCSGRSYPCAPSSRRGVPRVQSDASPPACPAHAAHPAHPAWNPWKQGSYVGEAPATSSNSTWSEGPMSNRRDVSSSNMLPLLHIQHMLHIEHIPYMLPRARELPAPDPPVNSNYREERLPRKVRVWLDRLMACYRLLTRGARERRTRACNLLAPRYSPPPRHPGFAIPTRSKPSTSTLADRAGGVTGPGRRTSSPVRPPAPVTLSGLGRARRKTPPAARSSGLLLPSPRCG